MQRSVVRSWRRILLTAALIALLLTSIGRDAFRGAQAQSDGIVGDYAVTLSLSDIPTDVVNGSMAIGHWRVSFKADGTYEAERLDLGVLITGTYETNDDVLTVTDQAGLLSCSNASAGAGGRGDAATATYGYKLDSRSLTLSPKDEPCQLRRAIFSSQAFTFYVACQTPEDNALGTPESDGATPVSDVTETADATPVDSGLDALSELSEPSTPVASDANSGDTKAAANAVDNLLKQLTACWATGDPVRFLPLLSQDFQAQFVSGSDQQNLDALNSLKAAMQVEIIWERAGDVDVVSDDRIECVVRTTAADQEEFSRYVFVLEDGEWHWDGTAS